MVQPSKLGQVIVGCVAYFCSLFLFPWMPLSFAHCVMVFLKPVTPTDASCICSMMISYTLFVGRGREEGRKEGRHEGEGRENNISHERTGVRRKKRWRRVNGG